MTNEPTFQDPPHHFAEEPCHWCGAAWVPDPAPLNSRSMQHAPSCPYIAWLNNPVVA